MNQRRPKSKSRERPVGFGGGDVYEYRIEKIQKYIDDIRKSSKTTKLSDEDETRIKTANMNIDVIKRHKQNAISEMKKKEENNNFADDIYTYKPLIFTSS